MRNSSGVFLKGEAHFYNEKLGSYSFKNDTLIVTLIQYLLIKDSFVKNEKAKFVAKILKINNDSLILKKIRWNSYGNTNRSCIPDLSILRFYNDTLNYGKKTDFTKISLSGSLCYGKCPAQAIEISSDGTYNFFGGKYSGLNGYYKGKIASTFIDSIKYKLTAATANRKNLSNGIAVDASKCDIVICFDKQDTLKIHGSPSDFLLRLQQLYSTIMASRKKVKLQKVIKPIDFITNSHISE